MLPMKFLSYFIYIPYKYVLYGGKTNSSRFIELVRLWVILEKPKRTEQKKECKTITRKSKFERNVSNASTSRERRKCSRFIKKWRVKWQASLNYLFRRIRMREHTIMKARKSGRIDTPTSFSVHHKSYFFGYLSIGLRNLKWLLTYSYYECYLRP